MSIASEITRLQNAKVNIKTAIEAKGVTVPSNALLDSFDTYIAQISGGGSTGLEYETGTFTPAQDIARPTINFSKTHSVPPAVAVIVDSADASNVTANSNLWFVFVDLYRLLNAVKAGTSTNYALYYFRYKTSSSASGNSGICLKSSDDSDDSSATRSRYWVNESGFKPSTDSTTRYWRVGRTYNWIAIWK